GLRHDVSSERASGRVARAQQSHERDREDPAGRLSERRKVSAQLVHVGSTSEPEREVQLLDAPPMKRILIVGGGTAGWITACYLARRLGAQAPGGARLTLVESADIGILGVGEGTFPTIRQTLRRIGVDEARLLRECSATFKQGAKFVHWR